MGGEATATEQEGPTSALRPPGWFNRAIWLGPRVAEARMTGLLPCHPGFEFYDVARQLDDEAGRIRRAGRNPWVVLLLDCTTLEWLVRAHLARAGGWAGAAQLGEQDWTSVQHLAHLEPAWSQFPAVHLSTLMAALRADRVGTLTSLSDPDRDSFAVCVRKLAQDLMAPLEHEANRLGWALFARWSRMALAAALLVMAVACVATWVSTKISPNLAYHRPVTASSLNGYGPDASRLVDGITDKIGFHTDGGDQQWVVIDLGEVKKLGRIVVYNRPDCCREQTVPLKVEVSNDNKDFRKIAERAEVFDKWTAKLDAEGRYVRLKNTPPKFFHLAEVEIY
jgi:hypothetical protein